MMFLSLLIVSSISLLDAASVVERARVATGIDRLADHASGLRLEGTLETERARTDIHLVFDARRRFAHHVLTEGAPSFGFDGETAWLEAADGAGGELTSADAVRLLATTWFLTGQWLLEDCPIVLSVSDETEALWQLDFEILTGGLEGSIEVSRGTGFPRAFRWLDGDVVIEHQLMGFRDTEGVRTPRRVVKREAGARASTWTFLTGGVAPDGALDRAALSNGASARFEAAASTSLVVKRLPSGHLLVKPMIDDRDVGWFLFDTGSAGLLLSQNDATRLELQPFGETRIHGVAGAFGGRFARGATLRLGPLVLERPLFTVVDMTTVIHGFGHPLSGLVGYDVIAPCVLDLDVKRGKISLYEPARSPFGDEVTWYPLTVAGRHCIVPGTVEGSPGRFVLDSGSDSALALRPAFVSEAELLEGRKTRRGVLSGASRRVSVRLGKVGPFDILGQTLTSVPTSFLEQASEAVFPADGIVGLPVFHGQRLILDVPRRRVALEGLDAR